MRESENPVTALLGCELWFGFSYTKRKWNREACS
jgi:hypothetical protein